MQKLDLELGLYTTLWDAQGSQLGNDEPLVADGASTMGFH